MLPPGNKNDIDKYSQPYSSPRRRAMRPQGHEEAPGAGAAAEDDPITSSSKIFSKRRGAWDVDAPSMSTEGAAFFKREQRSSKGSEVTFLRAIPHRRDSASRVVEQMSLRHAAYSTERHKSLLHQRRQTDSVTSSATIADAPFVPLSTRRVSLLESNPKLLARLRVYLFRGHQLIFTSYWRFV